MKKLFKNLPEKEGGPEEGLLQAEKSTLKIKHLSDKNFWRPQETG